VHNICGTKKKLGCASSRHEIKNEKSPKNRTKATKGVGIRRKLRWKKKKKYIARYTLGHKRTTKKGRKIP
jgi:hypothetical protein